jgi:hypothetical protein
MPSANELDERQKQKKINMMIWFLESYLACFAFVCLLRGIYWKQQSTFICV